MFSRAFDNSIVCRLTHEDQHRLNREGCFSLGASFLLRVQKMQNHGRSLNSMTWLYRWWSQGWRGKGRGQSHTAERNRCSATLWHRQGAWPCPSHVVPAPDSMEAPGWGLCCCPCGLRATWLTHDSDALHRGARGPGTNNHVPEFKRTRTSACAEEAHGREPETTESLQLPSSDPPRRALGTTSCFPGTRTRADVQNNPP